MEHNNTTGIGGASTAGDIKIHNIRVGDGNDAVSGNGSGDANDYIVL